MAQEHWKGVFVEKNAIEDLVLIDQKWPLKYAAPTGAPICFFTVNIAHKLTEQKINILIKNLGCMHHRVTN